MTTTATPTHIIVGSVVGGATGGSTTTTTTSGATGGSGPLTTSIGLNQVVGKLDHALSSGFLQSADQSGGASTNVGTGTSFVVLAGTTETLHLNLAAGDKLDLSQILAGAPLANDLTNIGKFVQVIGHGPNDPGFGQGTKTVLEISGPSGSAVVNLESSGKLNLHDLLKNGTFIPPHG